MKPYSYLVVAFYPDSKHEERYLCVGVIRAERAVEAIRDVQAQGPVEVQAYRLVPVEMRDGVLVEGGK